MLLRRGNVSRTSIMDRMLCTQCAAVSYSAAAQTLVEHGEPCPRCGGRVAAAPPEPVAVGAGEPDPVAAGRRFHRED